MDALLQQLVDSLTSMPSIGQKSAQRIALYFLEHNREEAARLGETLIQAMSDIKNCQSCRNYTTHSHCELCEDVRRDRELICVVETPSDMLAIEQSGVFRGQYFVLMGRLSPLDGLGPEELGLPMLLARLSSQHYTEMIVATSATPEGEATAYYLSEAAKAYPALKVTRIAHGVPMGGELEYIDKNTLSHALSRRELMS